jgi:acetyltransferase-like isoleucine patch superfamily enzyme
MVDQTKPARRTARAGQVDLARGCEAMILGKLIQSWRRWVLSVHGLHVDASCHVGPSVSIGSGSAKRAGGTATVGPASELCRGVELSPWGGQINIGRNVFLGPQTIIYGHGGVDIGDNTLIAMHCCIVSSNHTIPSRGQLIRSHGDIPLPTRIGADVWLGAGVKVMGGVTIGDGCVVGAGSVVVTSLPPYSVSVGVPAAVVRERT